MKDAISSRFPNLCSKTLRMVQFQPASTPAAVQEKPLRVAVVLSGGQAAGKDSWHPLDVSKCYLTTAFHRWCYAAAMGPGPCQEGRGQGRLCACRALSHPLPVLDIRCRLPARGFTTCPVFIMPLPAVG